MLVTFDSPVGRVTMFGDVAAQLIRMMGHSGTVPSAVLAEDVPEALANLKRALAAVDSTKVIEESVENETDDKEVLVSLRNRAFPLIKLLEDAVRLHCGVMWEQEGSVPLKF
ncbi:DUF1840 domain-containing protein [Methylocaldum sp.]|uniref:DUF1840 domain-containing protein n=1 Tax=Methylocaldum sp. TaxID=1969727 RepID=UPI002D2A8C9D|nr:DUF1840 domain-containing protein [Methylocaldum sp.]HYE34524.1 DUF1840 domain-containing protein [Methylocaldum sp.]